MSVVNMQPLSSTREPKPDVGTAKVNTQAGPAMRQSSLQAAREAAFNAELEERAALINDLRLYLKGELSEKTPRLVEWECRLRAAKAEDQELKELAEVRFDE